MNTDMDDLIRDAVRRQEQLAPDPARIRAALPARAASRRRTRTLVTVAAAVMAVVAVLVPVIAAQAPAPGTGSGPATFAAPERTAIPMYFRPTWLPDGMVEESRAAPLKRSTYLGTGSTWRSSSADSLPRRVSVFSTFEKLGNDLPDANVDVNGAPGHYLAGETQAQLSWRFDETTVLWVTTPDPETPEEVLLQIARSVKPDPTMLQPPIFLGWLPADLDGNALLEVTRDWPIRWEATIAVDLHGKRHLSVSIGAHTRKPRGETVTINGGTAYLDKALLTMDLDDGRQLVVRSGGDDPLTRNEIIRIAENVQLDPNPDVGWLGR